MRIQHLTLVGLVVQLLCTACRDKPSPPLFASYDSAGVRVARSAAPACNSSQAWAVSDSAVLLIGVTAGSDEYELFRVRGAARLPDGRIVIANEGSHQIRFYDASGVYLGSEGRQGAGPGEFQFMSGLWIRGDSIFVWDTGPNRLTVLGSDGTVVRTVSLESGPDLGNRNVVGVSADGTIVAVGALGPTQAEAQLGRTVRDRLVFSTYGPTGNLRQRVLTMAGGERYVFSRSGPIRWPYVPYGSAPVWAVGPDRLYVGSGARSQVEAYDREGDQRLLVRWQFEREPLTERDVAAFGTDFRAAFDVGPERELAERFLDEVPFPSFLPAYSAILTDTDRNLWVRRGDAERDLPGRWWVFAPDGRWMTETRIPPGIEPLAIGRNYVLGLRRTPLGVEHVVMYELSRQSCRAA